MNKFEYVNLCEEAWKHNKLYYVDNAPIISDVEFDQLIQSIIDIEKKHPDWIILDSPSQRVGSCLTGNREVVQHIKPMLSLANTYTEAEINEFFKRVEKYVDNKIISYVVELKIDGIAIALHYEKGSLIKGLTRGNGVLGEDVTANIRTIKNLPLQLRGEKIDFLEVRGEVFLPKKEFIMLNQRQQNKNKPLFANERNAAGGSLKLLDPQKTKERGLSLMIHGISSSSLSIFSHYEELFFCKEAGLPTSSFTHLCHSQEEVHQVIKYISTLRDTLPYQIDGVVIKVNDTTLKDKMGITGKNYKWAIAYKFAAEQAVTQIKKITLQVGRTGSINPIAELEPTFLAGSMISRATLHNEDEIIRKDIREGDWVIIEKGGDIIPKVVQVLFDRRMEEGRPWKMPSSCPCCGVTLVQSKEEVAIRCPNYSNCQNQLIARLSFFVGKSGMNIDHMGEKVVIGLIHKGKIQKFSDIYCLKREDLYELTLFKDKAVSNLINSIEKSRTVSADHFIAALGIRHVGKETAELIAQQIKDPLDLLNLDEDDLLKIEGIGPIVANSIINFFFSEENRKELRKLISLLNITPIIILQNKELLVFFNKTFVITGTIEGYSRKTLETIIKNNGGKVISAISSKIDFILVGDKPGSKLKSAKLLNIDILDKNRFFDILNS
ncbi:NAD-dependent DNA ligase LigA [Candidatus Clavichlamydia salmonicola]|uniref:NAD-dependent DNA ligase LigA n=1 Tax=Candidatus Clavichlamydia salmonicola TaxID=469812 RepID=UPI0018917330|nr:NAD-dependent DNA ligase LigA [Candidatus Clavichlamydia salmonicola]